jgi:predicted metalloprotease
MRWSDREESENVEDRRGMSMKTGAVAIGGGGLLLALVLLALGVDPRQVQQIVVAPNQQQGQANPGQGGGPPRPVDPEEETQAKFTRVILHDTEVIWGDLFAKMGKQYPNPTLVLFTDAVDSACGQADSAVGPFYCPGDAKVYIDVAFYRDMQRKLNAPGEFARAYVVAHEVGHHVQKLLGYARLVDEARRTGDKAEANRMSVRLELQADYLAGVWAYHGQKKFNFLDEGDVDTALNAAFQIGDDRLQKQARGYVVPDSFTHGTSKQRMRWFSQGFKTGDVAGAKQAFELDYDQL